MSERRAAAVERVSTPDKEGHHRIGSDSDTVTADQDYHWTVLGEDDFRDVRRELVSIKANYYQLGAELGIPPGELDATRKEHSHDVDQAFNEVILKWLRQLYNVSRFGPPTWKRLIEAVISPAGGNNYALAKEMALKHPGLVEDFHFSVNKTQVIHFDSTPKDIIAFGESSPSQLLQMNMERIQAKFASLLLDVQIALEAKNVKVSHVCQFLSQFLINRYEEVNYEKFSAIFMDVTKQKLWTYLHHSPLERLTEKFLCDDQCVQGQIKRYKSALSGFLVATKLIEYIEENPFPDEELEEEEEDPALPKLTKKEYRSLKVVLNLGTRKISDLSLMYVQELWENFAEEFDIPLLTTVIKKITIGSLKITWLVSNHMAEIIMCNSTKSTSVRFFRQHKIIYLSIDDIIIYDENQMMEVEKQFFEVCSEVPTDVGKVSALLDLGVDPNIELNPLSSDGETGLILACRNGQKAVAELLIDKGANVQHQDKKGFSALHHTSVSGHFEVAKMLSEKGAHIDSPAKEEKTCTTALILSCENGHKAIAELLINKGANLNYQDKLGLTALHWASQNGHYEVVKLLTERGAQVDVPANDERDGETALILACCYDHKDVGELLIQKGANVDYQDKIGFTALHWASKFGCFEVVQMLTDKGAQVDIPAKDDVDCDTALIIACFFGHKNIGELLIQRGANANYRDKGGFTALHCASLNGHFEVVKMLTEKGAQVGIQTKNGYTSVLFATRNGHVDVLQLLIDDNTPIKGKHKFEHFGAHLTLQHQPQPEDEVTPLQTFRAILKQESQTDYVPMYQTKHTATYRYGGFSVTTLI